MTWIDFITVIIVGYSIYRGYRDGLIMQVASLLGLVFGAIFAGKIAEFLQAIFKTSAHFGSVLFYLIAFVLILVGFSLLGKMVKEFAKAIHVGIFDKFGGMFFCALKWLLLFSIFLNVFEKFDRYEWVIKPETKQKSVTHNFVKGLMPVVVPFFTSDEKVKNEQENK